uniref:DPPIV_N domain-containing protein n=1 Tax=Caenorhabditis japonica TaxID=281687 RepID=A0A8R1HRF4_CAEJA
MRENESYEFPVKTFPELLNHSRSWKNELRSMSTQNFSKLGLLRAETKQLNLFAIAAAPGSSIQTLYTTPVPIECVEKLKPTDRKLEMKMRPAYRAELFNRKYFRQTPPSAEFSLLCERQRSQVVTGITDYEIKPKIGSKMIMLSGDQLFKYNPENELAWKVNIGEPTAEPMEVSSEGGIGNVSIGTKGCSAEHATSASGSTSSISTATKTIGGTTEPAGTFISSAKLAPCDDKYMAYVLNKQVFIEYNDRLVFRTTSNSKHITNGVPSYIVQEELERFEGIWWSETAPRLLYEHVNEECVENAHFGINGEPASAPMKYPKAGKNNAVSTLRMVIFENDTCYDVALKPGVLEKVCPRFEYITRAGFFSDGSTVWVQLMSRDQSECSLVLIPITDFELPRELRDATPPPKGVQLSTDLNMGHWGETSHEETMEKPPRGKLCKTVVVHRARNEYWINVHNAIYPLKIKDDDQPLYEFIYCLEKPNGSCLALLSAELDDNGHCRHTEETLLMAETHSINKTVGIRVDEERELVYYAANESHPTEWNICVAHYRQRVHRQLTENGICFKSERAHMKLALDFDHGFAVWMTSVGSPPQCRFYGLRWTQGEILPKPFYAANVLPI